MLFVIDANVVISSLIKKGTTFTVFKYNAFKKQCEFIAPEFLLSEINMEKINTLTKLSKEDVEKTFSIITEQIRFIPFLKFSDKLPEAMNINFKDSPYLALALTFKCPIFSGDKSLKKQTSVKVFSPRELLNILENK